MMRANGPQVRMNLKFLPLYVDNNSSHIFNTTKVLRIRGVFTGWNIPDNDLFGPYELMNFTLQGPYQDRDVIVSTSSKPGISTGAIVGICLRVSCLCIDVVCNCYNFYIKNKIERLSPSFPCLKCRRGAVNLLLKSKDHTWSAIKN